MLFLPFEYFLFLYFSKSLDDRQSKRGEGNCLEYLIQAFRVNLLPQLKLHASKVKQKRKNTKEVKRKCNRKFIRQHDE